ncbi:hypothetical protein K439DRAFT_194931 [Ramaria rubella]|nr:hypothetical protein K439DRAFT_603200 [Ramaria rubella]KAF8581775.1 hypothetical protein K439DRAFT_194931 [Ramaria rubella]
MVRRRGSFAGICTIPKHKKLYSTDSDVRKKLFDFNCANRYSDAKCTHLRTSEAQEMSTTIKCTESSSSLSRPSSAVIAV